VLKKEFLENAQSQDGNDCNCIIIIDLLEGGGKGVGTTCSRILAAKECYFVTFPNFTTFINGGNLNDYITYKQQGQIPLYLKIIK
jgi:hypothetical protein